MLCSRPVLRLQPDCALFEGLALVLMQLPGNGCFQEKRFGVILPVCPLPDRLSFRTVAFPTLGSEKGHRRKTNLAVIEKGRSSLFVDCLLREVEIPCG